MVVEINYQSLLDIAMQPAADIIFPARIIKCLTQGREKEYLLKITPLPIVIKVITSFLPQAIERYQALVADLKNVLETDVMQAREHLKTLLGQIRLLPSECGKFLRAELRHSTEGLIGLALDGSLKARMVAGARNGSNFKSVGPAVIAEVMQPSRRAA